MYLFVILQFLVKFKTKDLTINLNLKSSLDQMISWNEKTYKLLCHACIRVLQNITT